MIRELLPDRVWWHVCNDNRDAKNGVAGSIFWHGRWYLHLFREVLALCWAFGPHARHFLFSFRCTFTHDQSVSLTAALPFLFYLSVSIESPRFPSWSYSHGNRVLSFAIHHGNVWVNLWRDDDNGPWRSWRHIIIDPMRLLFGADKHMQRHVSLHEVVVPMPEKDYPATVEMYVSEWRRPRLPFVRRILRANIELEQPIPIPGKGENSWDLDDDAIYSLTCPARSPAEAIEAIQASAMRDRERYGGREWVPA